MSADIYYLLYNCTVEYVYKNEGRERQNFFWNSHNMNFPTLNYFLVHEKKKEYEFQICFCCHLKLSTHLCTYIAMVKWSDCIFSTHSMMLNSWRYFWLDQGNNNNNEVLVLADNSLSTIWSILGTKSMWTQSLWHKYKMFDSARKIW